MKCELCGRPALALVRTGKKRSRKAKAGHPRKIKDHSLCAECFEKQGDSQRTAAALKDLLKPAFDLYRAATEAEAEMAADDERRLRVALQRIAVGGGCGRTGYATGVRRGGRRFAPRAREAERGMHIGASSFLQQRPERSRS